MKKLISLLLAALLLTALVPVAAESIPAGAWYLVEAEINGQIVSTAALGLSMTITLNEDGTAQILTSYGEESSEEKGTWTAEDNKLTIIGPNESAAELVLEEDWLVMYQEDSSMRFSQDPNGTSVPEILPVAAESEDAFFGTWNLSTGSVGGINIPVETLGLTGALTIEPGTVTLDFDGETYASPSTLEDGKLKITDSDGTITFIVLNDNGQLSITVNGEDQEVIMYFAKAE